MGIESRVDPNKAVLLNTEPKRAFITGVTGQDGSYLAEYLLNKGYEVFGIYRRKSSGYYGNNLHNIANNNRFNIVSGDVTDPANISMVINACRPHEIYHLAAQSYVHDSWKNPNLTMGINCGGTMNILEAAAALMANGHSNPKIYIACSSEQFGKVLETPQKETTPFYPRSPYGVSKVAAYWMGVNYRESYNMFVSCGILFNHESERRGLEFVTRKITNYVANLKAGLVNYALPLGNLDAKRDWGYAPDYVEAMHLMLQQDKPDDYVIATGVQHSVRQLCEYAFEHVGIKDWQKYIDINKACMRPAEVDTLLGDPSKAMKTLNWQPKVDFKTMIGRMIDHDLKMLNYKGDQNGK